MGGDTPAPAAGVGAPVRPRMAATRRISRGNLWGILQGRLHVPMGDLRRQFQIDSDEVTPIQTPEGTFYVGLPADGAAVLGQLWHEGRIVFDCTPDLCAMVVRAIAPTRPTRPPASRTPLARPATGSRPVPTRAPAIEAGAGSPIVAVSPIVPRMATSMGGTGISYDVRPSTSPPRRAIGFEAVDEFLPAPSSDAFGLGEPDVPGPAPGRSGTSSEPPSTTTGAESGGSDATDDGAMGDDSGRRRRRGGIGRAARAR